MKLLSEALNKSSTYIQILDVSEVGLTWEGVQYFFEKNAGNKFLQALSMEKNNFNLPYKVVVPKKSGPGVRTIGDYF